MFSCCYSPPRLQLHALEAVGIWIPEEDGWAARHAACVGDVGRLQQGCQSVHVGHTQAEVPVAPAMLCGAGVMGWVYGRGVQGSRHEWVLG